ncbi:unnamed protein product [Spirodela intermedia]|uniref:VDE lipocalin domain-containing protein n=1 Tax=Spirodela intermedia TaxID=51605 RepID=A0A7I8J854_SPIIN|nr:unnamed protein product [Spirodela intermedia]CAA6666241.1 unnamed protein product [Spirodela intermedia]
MFFIETACLRLPAILPRPLLVASCSSLGGTAVGTVAVASCPQPSWRKLRSIAIRGPTSVRNGVAEAASCEPEGDARIAPRSVRIVAVVREGTVSPLKAERLRWADESCEMLVYTDADRDDLRGELARADILLMISVSNQEAIDWVRANSAHIPNVISFESASPSLKNKLGGSFVSMDGKASLAQALFGTLKGERRDESPEVVKTLSDAWGRHNSDDIRFCILVIINAYIRPVSSLKNLRAKGFSTLNCMIKNCGSEVLNCLLDPKCRKALQCLNGCSPTDQVCNYRCIASYESPNLEAFSLCVLQKHNCLGLDSDIPERPFVPPMERFRGEPLTHETAEDLFVGWLGELQWSWRVVAGQNPAYDQFPCQYQLFYRGKAKGSFWYEPVFRVKTLEGEMVWRRRRYRVRRAEDPGTFHLSVLDNGVISKEFWTVVDVSDDLSWGLFHYRGAAAAAGQSYAGAVLVSPDGRYPPGMGGSRLASALDKCRIKNWELYEVDNDDCESADAPLLIPEGSSFHRNIKVRDETWAST